MPISTVNINTPNIHQPNRWNNKIIYLTVIEYYFSVVSRIMPPKDGL